MSRRRAGAGMAELNGKLYVVGMCPAKAVFLQMLACDKMCVK